MENKYKTILVALGITSVGSIPVNAESEEATLSDKGVSVRKPLSSIFVEVETKNDKPDEEWNAGCSVSNSGCK